MATQSQWNDKIFSVTSNNFSRLALEIFNFQYHNNTVYHDYVDALKIAPSSIKALAQIPFLPIRFFKSHRVMTTTFAPTVFFESSGTTGSINSRHYLKDTELYKNSFLLGFNYFFGAPSETAIIGLLPSYLERNNASLVFMVDELIRQTGDSDSGFYLTEMDKLLSVLEKRERLQQKTLLIGVTFALLDLAEKYTGRGAELQHTIIMETGGMKGRRREMIREEVHAILKNAFGVPVIYSEYGMTELLSQAYSKGNGFFDCPPWMKIILRDEEDPLSIKPLPAKNGKPVSGAVNIVDMANVYSCSFIATDDAGRIHPDGLFEVLGRMDNSDLRGCSLMVI